MRTVYVDLNEGERCMDAGVQGEHNATVLRVRTEDCFKEADFFVCIFTLEEGRNVAGRTIGRDELRAGCFHLSIWRELTEAQRLCMTVEAYQKDDGGKVILLGKSPEIKLFFQRGIDTSQLDPPIDQDTDSVFVQLASAAQRIGMLEQEVNRSLESMGEQTNLAVAEISTHAGERMEQAVSKISEREQTALSQLTEDVHGAQREIDAVKERALGDMTRGADSGVLRVDASAQQAKGEIEELVQGASMLLERCKDTAAAEIGSEKERAVSEIQSEKELATSVLMNLKTEILDTFESVRTQVKALAEDVAQTYDKIRRSTALRRIRTFELQKEANLITLNVDNAGRPFSLRRAVIRVAVPASNTASVAGTFQMNFNGAHAFQAVGTLPKTGEYAYFKVDAEKTGEYLESGLCSFKSTSPLSYNANLSPYTASGMSRNILPNGGINTIQVWSYQYGYNYPIGTKIEIFGTDETDDVL